MRKSLFYIVLSSVVLLAAPAFAEESNSPIASIQKHWAEANYTAEGKDRKKAFKSLTEEADQLVQQSPDSADAHIWAGIVYSTYAGEVSMFSAGKQVKRARSELETAMQIEPDAMDGSAYTSLGALLYQIPGFMGGDEEKAEELLKHGLELNPQGIDSNYFYASFLIEQKRYDEAQQYLQKAANAPARPQRALADQGRKAEIASAISELQNKRS